MASWKVSLSRRWSQIQDSTVRILPEADTGVLNLLGSTSKTSRLHAFSRYSVCVSRREQLSRWASSIIPKLSSRVTSCPEDALQTLHMLSKVNLIRAAQQCTEPFLEDDEETPNPKP